MNETDKPLLFDEKAESIFQPAVREALTRIPELRSVVVIYDYYGPFNDVDGVRKGLWLSGDGTQPRSTDAVVGSLGNTLQSAAQMLDELFGVYSALSKQILELSRELLDLKNDGNRNTEQNDGDVEQPAS